MTDLISTPDHIRQSAKVKAVRLDRARGCLMGQVAGDSLGALVEFMTSDQIGARYPRRLHLLADGGPWSIIAGQCTDDSEMALTLARSLVAEGTFNREKVLAAYKGWYASGPFDIGRTTSAALSGGGKVAASGQASSQANGSLMRVSPIGIFAAGDPARAARLAAADSELTHTHPVCVAACSSFAAAISVGIAGGGRNDMLDAAGIHAGSGPGADAVRDRLAAARTKAPRDYQHQMGWVLTAHQNAFHHLACGSPMSRAVIDTVACGGDTDTNGAIVGALLGAADGIGAVPEQWIEKVTSCRPVATSGARRPRPERFWPTDVLNLAVQLLTSGSRAVASRPDAPLPSRSPEPPCGCEH